MNHICLKLNISTYSIFHNHVFLFLLKQKSNNNWWMEFVTRRQQSPLSTFQLNIHQLYVQTKLVEPKKLLEHVTFCHFVWSSLTQMVGGWRSEISWLLLIHYELLENEESFYRFLTVLLNIDWNYFNVTKFYTEWKTKGILNCKCLHWEMNQIYKNYVREGLKKNVENSTFGRNFLNPLPLYSKNKNY